MRQRSVPPVVVIEQYADDDAEAFDRYVDVQRAELVVVVNMLVSRPAGEPAPWA